MKNLKKVLEKNFLKDLKEFAKLTGDVHPMVFCTISIRVEFETIAFVKGFLVEREENFKFVFIEECASSLLKANKNQVPKCVLEIYLRDNISRRGICRSYPCFCYLDRNSEALIEFDEKAQISKKKILELVLKR